MRCEFSIPVSTVVPRVATKSLNPGEADPVVSIEPVMVTTPPDSTSRSPTVAEPLTT